MQDPKGVFCLFTILFLLFNIFDTAFHVKGLFILRIVLAVENFCKRANCVGERHVLAFLTGERLGNGHRLREEALNLPRAIDQFLIFVGEFFDTENGDDVLQVLVALEYAAGFVGHAVVFFADDLGRERGRAALEGVNGGENRECRELAGKHYGGGGGGGGGRGGRGGGG